MQDRTSSTPGEDLPLSESHAAIDSENALTRNGDKGVISSSIQNLASKAPRTTERETESGALGWGRSEAGIPYEVAGEGMVDLESSLWTPGSTTPVRMGLPPFGAIDLHSPEKQDYATEPFARKELSGAYPNNSHIQLATSPSRGEPLQRQDSWCSLNSGEGSVKGGMRRSGSFQSMLAMTEDGRRRLKKLGRETSMRTLKNIGAKAAVVAAIASPSNIADVVTKNANPNLRSQGQRWNHWAHKYKAFDPRSHVVTTWHLLLLVTLSAQCIKLPIDVCFYPVQPERAWSEMAANARSLFIVGRLFDTIYLFDIVMNFWTGFYHEPTQAYILTLPDVARRYFLSWFFVDSIAIVPWEMCFVHGLLMRSIKLMKVRKMMTSVRANRLTNTFVSRNEVDLQIIQLVQEIFSAFVIVHMVCCSWCFILQYEQRGHDIGMSTPFKVINAYEYGFADDGVTPVNWVVSNDVMGGEFEYYVAALQLLVQGEMQLVSLAERLLLIISMAILYALFIFIIAEVASIVSEIGYRNKKYRQTMREVNLMMREHKFPGDLRYRLRKYIRFRHVQQDGNSAGVSLNASPERRYILSLLSPQLRQEAMVHMNNVGIGQVKLFQDSELPNDALLALSVGAHIEVYAGHEFIYKAGDAAVSLNVVVKGVVSNKGRLVRRRDTFGEEACLSAHSEYIGSAYTITFCSICHLNGVAIKRMFKKYPLSETKMRKQLARKFAREGLRAYVRYVNAANKGKLEEFKSDFFNQGFSESMFYRMYLTHSKSVGEFELMERCALQIQRVWRAKVLRRKVETAQYRARMDRAGLSFGQQSFLKQGRGERLLGGFASVKDFVKAAKAMNDPLTDNQRLESMELNQRQMMETLTKLHDSLNELTRFREKDTQIVPSFY